MDWRARLWGLHSGNGKLVHSQGPNRVEHCHRDFDFWYIHRFQNSIRLKERTTLLCGDNHALDWTGRTKRHVW